ncbi:hypothetical protein O9992_25545 [Vibrio lentus]|nr:hypothetical protein [Vibrio lentus]
MDRKTRWNVVVMSSRLLYHPSTSGLSNLSGFATLTVIACVVNFIQRTWQPSNAKLVSVKTTVSVSYPKHFFNSDSSLSNSLARSPFPCRMAIGAISGSKTQPKIVASSCWGTH